MNMYKKPSRTKNGDISYNENNATICQSFSNNNASVNKE